MISIYFDMGQHVSICFNQVGNEVIQPLQVWVPPFQHSPHGTPGQCWSEYSPTLKGGYGCTRGPKLDLYPTRVMLKKHRALTQMIRNVIQYHVLQ